MPSSPILRDSSANAATAPTNGFDAPDAADPPAGLSRYGALAQTLRQRIQLGEWQPGVALPSEATLAKAYGVALGTMRQALALLVQDGLLERHHGKGTFVKEGLGGASMLRFFRFGPADRHTKPPDSHILQRHARTADPHEQQRFGLPVDAQVLVLRRLRSFDERPCLLEDIVLPLPLFAALQTLELQTWDSLLYPMYQRRCGVAVHHATDHLQFDLLQPDQAALLNLGRNHPCARVQRQAFDLNGRCVELRTTVGDAYAFEYTADVR